MSDQIHIRHYEPTDYDMISEWCYFHGKHPRPEPMLPKCGVICEMEGEPVSALFLCMDNSSGMCMADHAVSKPRLPLKKALLAFRHCMACLQKIAIGLGYHTMAVFTYEGIAKVLKNQGFQELNRDQVFLVKPLLEEAHNA
jgi:hypothetical protein